MGKHTHICKQCGKTYENYKENSNFVVKFVKTNIEILLLIIVIIAEKKLLLNLIG